MLLRSAGNGRDSKRIFIDVSNVTRDGIGACYLAALLRREGFDVLLADGILSDLFKFRPHVIVLGNVQEIKGFLFSKYARLSGAKVVVLPVEGVFCPSSAEDVSRIFTDKFTKDYSEAADLWLCWGRSYADMLTKYLGVMESRIRVCGCPRFDIYSPPLSKIVMPKGRFCEKYGLDPRKKIVTLATHFIWADSEPEKMTGIMYAEDIGFVKKQKIEEAAERGFAVGSVLELAREFGDTNFILKLHPWEDAEHYVQLVRHAKAKNVKLIKGENIAHVIKNSDLWLHVNCTTAKEAAIMGKPVVSLHFIGEYAQGYDKFSLMCDTARTYEELREKAASYLDGNKPTFSNDALKYLKGTFHKLDGRSTERCVREIKGFVGGQNISPKMPFSISLMPFFFTYDLRKILRRVIYSSKRMRALYLGLRWGKSVDYLEFTGREEFAEQFEQFADKTINEIHERCWK